MNIVKSLIISLLVFGLSSSVMAWHIKLFNETPFLIQAKAKSWRGALKGGWKKINPYQDEEVGLPGADCIDGFWIHMILPTGGQAQGFVIPTIEVDLGYYHFKSGNRCSNTHAVFGVTPQVVTTDVKNPTQTATNATTQTTSVTAAAPRNQTVNALTQFSNQLNAISNMLANASTGGVTLTEHDYKSILSGFKFYVGHMEEDKIPVQFQWNLK